MDDESVLSSIQWALKLDAKELEVCQAHDKAQRQAWLNELKRPYPIFFLAATTPLLCPVNLPQDVVQEGLHAVEEYAKLWGDDQGEKCQPPPMLTHPTDDRTRRNDAFRGNWVPALKSRVAKLETQKLI